MKNFKIFALPTLAIATIALIVFSCNKENDTITSTNSAGCNFNYGPDGYIVQENGILNFSDAGKLSAFIDTMAQLSDSAFAIWEAASGANTAYGNYIKADSALSALMSQYENDPNMTDSAFVPIFDTFALNNAHLAVITVEGVEPYFSFPFYYFVNENGIYRICDQEFSVQGNLLLSYPVGKQDLVATWNGEVGEFGELSVQRINRGYGNGQIQEKDEFFSDKCTAKLGKKKRIKVFWKSAAFRQPNVPDGNGEPTLTAYFWSHQAEVKAQRRSWGIWWRDTRHISLAVTGTITNRHLHKIINFSKSYNVNFFKCKRAHNIKERFAGDFFVNSINSDMNDFVIILTVTGTNRKSNCQTIQASCTLNINS